VQNSFSMPSSVSSIGSLDKSGIGSLTGKDEAPSADNVRSFGQTLADALGGVNQTMDNAKKASEGLLTGNAESLHEVQIAGAKAEIMMKLTTTITSKLAQATTQLFQMQV
jgi:flagellar hook-basal body complex protein FliE